MYVLFKLGKVVIKNHVVVTFYRMSYAITVLAIIVCPSVWPFIHPSQVGVIQRWLNLRLH